MKQYGGAQCNCAGKDGSKSRIGCRSDRPHENGKCTSWDTFADDWDHPTDDPSINFCGRCLRDELKGDSYEMSSRECQMCDGEGKLKCPHKVKNGSMNVVCLCRYCQHGGDRWTGRVCRCSECITSIKTIEFKDGCPDDYATDLSCEEGKPCYHCKDKDVTISITSASRVRTERSNELYKDVMAVQTR